MHREPVATPLAPGAIGPYSQAVRAEGAFLFLSGQIPLTVEGELVLGPPNLQATQCLKNLEAVLLAAGLTMKNLVKTTIYLKSMDYFAEVNAAYGAFFDSEPPARATVAVAGLPRGVDVEIDGIAVY